MQNRGFAGPPHPRPWIHDPNPIGPKDVQLVLVGGRREHYVPVRMNLHP